MKFQEGEVDPPKEEDLLKEKEPLSGAQPEAPEKIK